MTTRRSAGFLFALLAGLVLIGCGESRSQATAPPLTSTPVATATPVPAPSTANGGTTGRRRGPATGSQPGTAPASPDATPSAGTRPQRQRPSAQPTPQAQAAPSTTQSQADGGVSCPNNSLANCFTRATMPQFLDQATQLVGDFFATAYAGMPAPRVQYVSAQQAGRSPCGVIDGEDAYEYCGGNDTIYIGQGLLWTFYDQFGDAAPVVALAHEWGHHVQAELQLPQPRTAAQSVNYEDQADCVAGAWTQYAGQQGWLENGDVSDVDSLLQAIGSNEGPGQDHGTATQRRQSFDMGMNGGLTACNSFFPASAIAGAA